MRKCTVPHILFLLFLVSGFLLAGCSQDNGNRHQVVTGGSTGTGGDGSSTPGNGGDIDVPGGNTGIDTGVNQNNINDTPTNDSIRLLFAGDIMLARKVADVVKKSGSGNYAYPLAKIASVLKSADLAFANLESIITDKGTAISPSQVSAGTAFRASSRAIDALKSAGIDVVSVANNHIFDYGRSGMEDSLKNLKSAGIVYTGAGSFDDAYGPKIMTVKGTRIAYLAYTLKGSELWRAQKQDLKVGMWAQTGVAWLYTKYLEQGIYQARQQADIIIVSFHFGTEYTTLPTALEDRYAHLALDRGADLVIGHHPHVTQPIMKYGKGYIAYSLGNCVFDQTRQDARKGMLLDVRIAGKKIESVRPMRIVINANWQPELVAAE